MHFLNSRESKESWDLKEGDLTQNAPVAWSRL